MTPETKTKITLSTKYILTVVGIAITIIVSVVTATASITTKYNTIRAEFTKVENDFKVNNNAHSNIIESLTLEVARATAADKTLQEEVKEVKAEVKEVGDNQIKVMTNQAIILKAVEKNQ